MQKFFADYVMLLEERHNEILAALEGLPATALDWVPGTDMNSISVLVVHLTGAERYWIGDVAARDPAERDRDAEFRVQGLSIDFLKQRLSDNLEYARKTLDRFTIEDLQTEQPARGGHTYTVAWALLHALEHLTLHLGQIQLTRQLWEQSAGKN
jgi:uncharacterized damage-inducible protein DinB